MNNIDRLTKEIMVLKNDCYRSDKVAAMLDVFYHVALDDGEEIGYKIAIKENPIEDNCDDCSRCDDCSSYDDGRLDGRSDGYDEGKTEGYTDGWEEGVERGKSTGYKDGYKDGLNEGLKDIEEAETLSYNKGFEEGKINEQKKIYEERY